jgi:hypothetical protein
MWATENGTDRAVAAARSSDIEARECSSDLIEGSGLDVVGFRLGGSERETWFLPLDGGAAAQDFRDRLQRGGGCWSRVIVMGAAGAAVLRRGLVRVPAHVSPRQVQGRSCGDAGPRLSCPRASKSALQDPTCSVGGWHPQSAGR